VAFGVAGLFINSCKDTTIFLLFALCPLKGALDVGLIVASGQGGFAVHLALGVFARILVVTHAIIPAAHFFHLVSHIYDFLEDLLPVGTIGALLTFALLHHALGQLIVLDCGGCR
jgi:hypothetical protein